MNNSQVRIIAANLIGTILKVIGILFFAIIAIIGVAVIFGSGDIVAIFITVIFLAISYFIVKRGSKITSTVKRFKHYVNIMSSEKITSINQIATKTQQSLDFVKTDIQKMIDNNFFTNAYIDEETNEIIIGNKNKVKEQQSVKNTMDVKYENVKCIGCGALNSKPQGINIECEYCGNTIK